MRRIPPEEQAMITAPTLRKSVRQEVRIAVVMYGGVSLAIYMNGVAQELYRLVRATAPRDAGGRRARPFEELRGTERVYRKLGQMLRRGEPALATDADYLASGGATAGPGRPVRAGSPVLTRFVIDVISGTSAGGINGVFLAKALANNQSIDELKDLWVEKGDFGELLNDKRRRGGDGSPVQSLLDGGYMYRELLKALEGMGPDAPAGESAAAVGAPAGGGAAGAAVGRRRDAPTSPYTEELDLYVTTTDISGLPLPLRLAGGVVEERRHRNVFRFSYATRQAGGEPHNHFTRRHNPFLAFAARCTSSFPIAFEPMRLKDIDDTVRATDLYRQQPDAAARDQLLSPSPDWQTFYPDYVRGPGDEVGEAAARFAERAFGDGGYLDNKPFSYATDTLARRRADLPVDRKLIFVDPDPQNPSRAPDHDRDVDVLENTLAALSPTVSTETIREDVQRIHDRNRLLERVAHFVEGVEKDVRWRKAAAAAHAAPTQVPADAGPDPARLYTEAYLDELIQTHGVTYGGYHRIKVAALTDELTGIIVRAANFEEGSDEFVAIRDLFRAWREMTYSLSVEDSSGRTMPSQTRFLFDFDIDYRLRRLNFMRAKIDELTCIDADSLPAKLDELRSGGIPAADLGRRGFARSFQKALRKVRRELSGLHFPLLRVQLRYRRKGSGNPLRAGGSDLIDPARTGITRETLGALLGAEGGKARREVAGQLLLADGARARDALDRIAAHLAGDFGGPFNRDPAGEFKRAILRASGECARVLRREAAARFAAAGAPPPATSDWHARAMMRDYYDDFESYDQVIFPVMYETGVGETDTVEVIRVSPYDATTLIDEAAEDRREREGGRGRRKLGGTSFGHFGAFLKREWRTNDILWGRLDAAESIIRALLPESHAGRAALIEEAQREILTEELLDEKKREGVRGEVVRMLLSASAARDPHAALDEVKRQLAQSPPGEGPVRDFFESFADPASLVGYFRDERGYEVDRRLDPQAMARLAGRATRVFGRVLESLAEKHRVGGSRVAWVTRLGQVFWGLVEVAVPGSFWNLFFLHWIKLLYAFEAFLIVGGLLLADGAVQRFGLVTLAVTAAAHFFVKLLGDYMRGSRYRFLRAMGSVLFVLAAAAVLASAALGFDELTALWSRLGARVAGLPPFSWIAALPASGSRSLLLFGSVAAAAAVAAVVLGGVSLAARSLAALAAKAVAKLSRAASAALGWRGGRA
jgi:patatin-related protein